MAFSTSWNSVVRNFIESMMLTSCFPVYGAETPERSQVKRLMW